MDELERELERHMEFSNAAYDTDPESIIRKRISKKSSKNQDISEIPDSVNALIKKVKATLINALKLREKLELVAAESCPDDLKEIK